SSRGLRETGAPLAADPAPGAGPGRLRWAARPQSGGSAAVGAVARRGRGVGLRAGGPRAENGKESKLDVSREPRVDEAGEVRSAVADGPKTRMAVLVRLRVPIPLFALRRNLEPHRGQALTPPSAQTDRLADSRHQQREQTPVTGHDVC